MKEPAVQHDAGANSGADREKDKVAYSLPTPIWLFRNGGSIHIVFYRRRNAERGFQQARSGTSRQPMRYDVAITMPSSTSVTPGAPAATARSKLRKSVFLQQIFHTLVNQAHNHMWVTNARGRNLPFSQDLAVHVGQSKTQAGASDIGAHDIARFDLLRIPTWTGGFLVATSIQ